MTTIFLDINDEIYIIKCLIYIITTKSYKNDTEKLENWEKATLSCPLASTNFAIIRGVFMNPSPMKIVSMYQTIWMNPIEITPNRRGDKKTHLRADIRCKRTPFSVQGEHFKTAIFWIPDGGPLHVRLRVVENLRAMILIPITVRTEKFANLFVTLKISRTLDKRENQSLDDILDYMDRNLGRYNEASHINILHALVDLFDNWAEYQMPLAASCYKQSPADHRNWVERSILPNCNNSPQFEATTTWKLVNSYWTRDWRVNESPLSPTKFYKNSPLQEYSTSDQTFS